MKTYLAKSDAEAARLRQENEKLRTEPPRVQGANPCVTCRKYCRTVPKHGCYWWEPQEETRGEGEPAVSVRRTE